MRRRAFIKRASGLIVPLAFPAIVRGQFAQPQDLAFWAPSASVPLTPGQTKASAWAARVVANGGADPTGSETVALATFWDGMISDGLDSKMIQVNHLSPNSKTAVKTPFILGGGNDPWTEQCGNNGNTTVVLGVNGVQANLSNTITWDTGILDSTAFASDNDGGVTIYIYTTVNENAWEWGYTNDALTNDFAFLSNTGNLKVANCRSQVSGGLAPTDANNQGYFSLNRTASNSLNLYFANSGVSHFSMANTATAESGARQAKSFYFAGVHATDHGALCTGFNGGAKQYSFFAIHNGLTSGQSTSFFNRIQSLRTSLGGGAR